MKNRKNLGTAEKEIREQPVRSIKSRFLHMSIARKLMLGFCSLLVLLISISAYALFNLKRLNEINQSILNTDLPVIAVSEKMIDVLLAQELYAQRYLILGSPDVLKSLWDREKEFDQLLDQLAILPADRSFPINQMIALHADYNQILLEGLDRSGKQPAGSMGDFEARLKAQQELIIAVIKDMSTEAQLAQIDKTNMTASIGNVAFKAAAILCGLGLILSLSAAALITRNISGAIKKLKYATTMISQGKFDFKPDIRNRDELGDLADAFITMADRLKCLEEMYLDTSPLTRLPGGVAIENVLNKRIATKQPIAFCMMDIDNFKAFNDHYGYAKGNEIIQETANIISEAAAAHGTENDFIGHIGGDDYVLITRPQHYARICEAIIKNFDRRIPTYYADEDRSRGYIIGENRQGQQVSFPLASISIAVVTNERRKLNNHIRFGEIAAEMKEHVKSIAGSVYKADRRDDRIKRDVKDRKLITLKDHQLISKGSS